MASQRFHTLKIYSNSNIFCQSKRSTEAHKGQSRPPYTAGFEVESPAAPRASGLQSAVGAHTLGQWSPSPSVVRELMDRRGARPAQSSLGCAARSAKFAPLRFEGRDEPQHKKLRLADEPHRPAAAALSFGQTHSWAQDDESVQRPSTGKLRITFPTGINASKRLSARRPQHGRKPRVAGAADMVMGPVRPDLLRLQWHPNSSEPGVSPAPSAPETPDPTPRDVAHVDVAPASAQEPEFTTAADDAMAVALPTPPTHQPAATTFPSGPSGLMDPTSVLPQSTVPLQAVLAARDASSLPDTFYHPTAYRPVRGAPRLRQPRRGEATEACRRPECAEDGARAPHSWRGRCSQGTHCTSVRAILLRVSPLNLSACNTPAGEPTIPQCVQYSSG